MLRELQPGDKLEIILDLGSVVHLGRLRVVWTEVSGIPEERVVNTFLDDRFWATRMYGANE